MHLQPILRSINKSQQLQVWLKHSHSDLPIQDSDVGLIEGGSSPFKRCRILQHHVCCSSKVRIGDEYDRRSPTKNHKEVLDLPEN